MPPAPQQKEKDLLTRLGDVGEAAIQRLTDVPGGDRFAGAANALRDRLDELQRRVRGLEQLDKRLTALERRVDRLQKGAGGPSRSRSSRRTTARKTTSTRSTSAPAAAPHAESPSESQ